MRHVSPPADPRIQADPVASVNSVANPTSRHEVRSVIADFATFVRDNSDAFVVNARDRGATTSDYVICNHNPPTGPRINGAQFEVQNGVGRIVLETSQGEMIFQLPKVPGLGIASNYLMDTIRSILEGTPLPSNNQARAFTPANAGLPPTAAGIQPNILSAASMPRLLNAPGVDHQPPPLLLAPGASATDADATVAANHGPHDIIDTTAIVVYSGPATSSSAGGLARRAGQASGPNLGLAPQTATGIGGSMMVNRTDTAREIISEIMCALSSVGYLRDSVVQNMNVMADYSWAGLDMTGSRLSNLTFEDHPGGDMASLVATNLSGCVTDGRVKFSDVAAEGLKMHGLRNLGQMLNFHRCDLRAAEFKNAQFAADAQSIADKFSMRGCDIRGANFEGCAALQRFLLTAPAADVLKVFKGTVYDATTRFSEDSAIDKQIKDRLEKMSGGIQNAHGEMTGQRVIAHLENSPVADTLRMRFGGSDATLIPVGDTAYVVSARADGGVNFVQNNGAGGRVVSGVDMAHDVASAAAAEALRRRQAA